MARLQAHLAHGDTVALVSAAPLPPVAAIARHLGVPHAIGTRFATNAAGRYTGRVIPPPALDAHKWRLAQDYFAARGAPLDPAEGYAYADSITDLALLEAVAHPIAAFPDPALETVAHQRGWEILALNDTRTPFPEDYSPRMAAKPSPTRGGRLLPRAPTTLNPPRGEMNWGNCATPKG